MALGRNRERLAWIDVYKAYQNVTESTRKLVVDLIERYYSQSYNNRSK